MFTMLIISFILMAIGTGILLVDSNNVLWFIAYFIAIANFGLAIIVWAIKEEFKK